MQKGDFPMNFKGRSFLKLLDYTPAEIGALIDLAADLKAKKKAGIPHDTLKGKNIALIFEKTSTRTRCSFEVAAHDLGMQVTYLDPQGSQIGKKESIADTAHVLGRMFDGIEYRGYGQEIVEELAKYAGVPVWNGLTKGEPVEVWAERINDLAPYQINAQLMAAAGPKAVFMHCLPAYHDHKTAVGKEMGERFNRDAMEVTDEVFQGPQSIVFDEAENRMHTIKAVMAALRPSLFLPY